MHALLYRYQIFIICILFLLAPSGEYMQSILTWHRNALTTKEAGGMYIPLAAGFQMVGLFWLAIQLAEGAHADCKQYLLSLPLSNQHYLMSDILLLIRVNLGIWLLLGVTCLLGLTAKPDLVNIEYAIYLLYIPVSMLLLQLAWIRKYYTIIIVVLLLELGYGKGGVIHMSIWEKIAVTIGIFSTSYYLRGWLENRNYSRAKQALILQTTQRFSGGAYKYLAWMKLHTIELLHDSRFCCVRYLLVLAALIILTYCYPQQADILLLVTAYLICNLYMRLQKIRANYQLYIFSLPLSRFHYFMADYCLISAIFTIQVISVFCLEVYSGCFKLTRFSYALSSGYLFLAACYIPQLRYLKYGGLISLIIVSVLISLRYFYL